MSIESDKLVLQKIYEVCDGKSWIQSTNWMSNKPLGEWFGVTVENGRVTELNLSNNMLRGKIPIEIDELYEVKVLNLSGNSLEGKIPSTIGEMKNVEVLNLSDNNLSGAVPSALGKLPSPRVIALDNNNLSGEIPMAVSDLVIQGNDQGQPVQITMAGNPDLAMSTFDAIRTVTGLNRPEHKPEMTITEVQSGLYITAFRDIEDKDSLRSLGVTTEINFAPTQCLTGPNYYGPDVKYVEFNVTDTPEANVKQYFDEVNKVIDESIRSGGGAVVHCYNSISRATVFVIAYLMKENKISALEAIALLKQRWDTVWPNDGFVNQLIEYENELGIASSGK